MRTVLYTQAQAHATKHVEGVFFQCDRCRFIKPVQTEGGTGYGYPAGSDRMHCFACCGQTDRLDMIKTGKATLYLSKDGNGWKITNWPGTLTIKPSHVRSMNHPFACKAYIAYFRFAGASWSAKNIGDSEIAHCRRLAS